MTMNNKILTVSYGTFSCTLEGFDDSFGTMKAIAEYFRDLAADDRYFGAEPPVPDAEMLTRIAEREISRRVEARHDEGRIVLSAASAARETPLHVADAQPKADAQPEAAPLAAAAIAATVAHTSEVNAAEAEAGDAVSVTEEVNVETLAATLEEEDSGQAEAEDAPEVDEVAADTEEDIAEDASAVLELTEADMAPAPEPVQEDADAQTAADDAPSLSEAEAFFASTDAQITDEVEEDSEALAEVAPVAATAPPAADSIAAKLQRIRAVVSQSQQDAAEEELFEDEHAEDLPAEGDAQTLSDDAATDEIASDEDATDDAATVEAQADDVIAEAARDIEDAFDIDDAAALTEDTDAQDQDELSAMLARIDSSDADAPQEPAVAQTDVPEEDMGLDSLAALIAADDAPDAVAGDCENLFDVSETGEDDDETDAIASDEVEVEVEVEDASENAPRRARVIKVKRADIDAALASGQLEQVEDEDEDEHDFADAASTLSDDEEAELLAELAQVEAELPADTDSADTEQDDDSVETAGEAEPEVADAPSEDIAADADDEAADAEAFEDEDAAAEPAIAADSKPLDVQDDDVTRLMAEAENQMEEPEGTNRRDAFAHLKAAVKAKKADSDIGSDSIKDEGAFRSDLAEVVKPRRPEVGSSRADRPEKARPAPLKLVAEQRVDIDTAPKGPVRPRRIAAPQEVATDAQGADSFADYAAELGANDLPALLEAAASYLSFVEGQDQFSRPQLMTKVRQIEKEDFSREDSLRSFGQLLRSGKIEKIAGGRFAVTSDIGYRPEQRAAG